MRDLLYRAPITSIGLIVAIVAYILLSIIVLGLGIICSLLTYFFGRPVLWQFLAVLREQIPDEVETSVRS